MTVTLDRETVTTDASVSVDMPASVLRRMLAATVIGTGRDYTLPVLTGVQLSWQDGKITTASTDRYRLTVCEHTPHVTSNLPGDFSKDAAGSVLIPRGDVERIVKLIPTRVPSATLEVRLAHVGREANADRWSVSLPWMGDALTFGALDGSFPTWEPLIPSDEKLEESDGVSEIAWNPAYMADVAKVAKAVTAGARWNGASTAVRMRFTAPDRPMVMEIPADDVTCRYLLMPVRLTGSR